MEIKLSYLGIGNLISTLEEEKRCAVRIRELLQALYNQETANPMADLGAIRAKMDAASKLSDSITKRIQFLSDLSEEFRSLSARMDEELEELKGAIE